MLARNITAFLRQEEGRDGSDFIGETRTAQRRALRDFFQGALILDNTRQHIRLNGAWPNAVDANAIWRKFNCHRPRHLMQAAF